MNSSTRPTPTWDLTGRQTTSSDSTRLQAAHGRIGPKGLKAFDAKACRPLGNAFRVTVARLAAIAPAGGDSCTSHGQTVPASAMPERVAAQPSVGRGGES